MRRLLFLIPLLLLPATCSADARDRLPVRGAWGVTVDTSRVPQFSGDSAHALLRAQVAFGPRVPGEPGHAAQLAWMTEFLRERADTLMHQPFSHRTRAGEELRLTNVFAQFRPDLETRLLLVAHWDTRPTADMDPARPGEPILGANDGASGVAVLLELANVLSRHSPPVGVDILLVDGEDYGPGEADMYLGARVFARNQPPGYRPLYGIVVDMVADTEPVFPMEGYSVEMAPEVVDRVWGVAEQVGLGHIFVRRRGGHVMDDHLPLNRAGLRTIVIIDFDYGPDNAFWHTHQDVVENTSPVGLDAVGRVLAALIYSGG